MKLHKIRVKCRNVAYSLAPVMGSDQVKDNDGIVHFVTERFATQLNTDHFVDWALLYACLGDFCPSDQEEQPRWTDEEVNCLGCLAHQEEWELYRA